MCLQSHTSDNFTQHKTIWPRSNLNHPGPFISHWQYQTTLENVIQHDWRIAINDVLFPPNAPYKIHVAFAHIMKVRAISITSHKSGDRYRR